MKHFWSKLYIALALLLCLTPSLGLLVFGESGAAAHQRLAPRPALQDRDGNWNRQVLNDSADWLSDHFALRQQLVSLWGQLNAALLRSSPEEQVILGKGDWLFYAPTLADYSGQSLSDEELAAVAARLAQIQAEAESRGAQFLFTVAPNKNSLHPEAMPDVYPRCHEESSVVRLRPYLEQYGVHYADLFSLPMPYYHTDTHWTPEGAAMAADRLLAALGRESAYAAGPFPAAPEAVPGDLYEMLYPARPAGETTLVYAGQLRFEHLDPPQGGSAITIRTEGGGTGSLYCWRDSFGIALYPYLADAFGQACFSRSADYRLLEGNYDVVILEIAERSIPNLIK